MRKLVRAILASRLRCVVLAIVAGAALLFAGPSAAQCNFDIDGNGSIDPLTDGLLISRAARGLTGAALTQGALGPGATRDATAILSYYNANKAAWDLDGNGTFDPQTDGLLLIRSLFGMTGPAVTSGALAGTAARTDWNGINAWLANDCGAGSDVALRDAARLLNQATWGPKYSEIFSLAGSPAPQVDNWITLQFAQPRVNHIDWIIARDAATAATSMSDTNESFWRQSLAGPDQLRQRIAFALSQIMVVSNQKDGMDSAWLMSGYYDMLLKNAFGNFRTLLEDITKNPAMARYLDMMCNDRDTTTRVPNENYAREVLQLFTIGTEWLNPDGTRMLDGQSQPIPTYDQTTIQGFAKVFTGWSYSGTLNWCQQPPVTNNTPWYAPVIAFNSHHSFSAKTLLALAPGGTPVGIAAVTSANANAQVDLTTALDNIFNHPNVGPYIGKQLIHFLVTSNPGPAYVSRVAANFADNGNGVRGDMQAVIRAILTDTEARDPVAATQPTFGKLREPAIRFGNLMRSFHATAASGRYSFYTLGDPQGAFNQQPLASPTVFNFFGFDFAPQGPVGTHGLVGPEFEATTSTSIVGTMNSLKNTIFGGWGSGTDAMNIDYAALLGLAAVPGQLVNYLNLVMTSGAMTPTTSTQIATAVALVPQTGPTWQADRWKMALWILSNSPEYSIQR